MYSLRSHVNRGMMITARVITMIESVQLLIQVLLALPGAYSEEALNA